MSHDLPPSGSGNSESPTAPDEFWRRSDGGTRTTRRKSRTERIVTRVLTFAAFMGLGFVILRYVFGAGHTLALSLAYIDAVISIGFVDLKERLDA